MCPSLLRGIGIALLRVMWVRFVAFYSLLALVGFSSTSWGQAVDFFSPKISLEQISDDLFRRPGGGAIEVLLEVGGEAVLYVEAEKLESGIRVSVSKRFLPGLIERNVEALDRLTEFSKKGLLGEIKVIKKHSVQANVLTTEYIEGETIYNLHQSHKDHPQFQLLWSRYISSLQVIRNNLEKLGYSVDASVGVLEDCRQLLDVHAPLVDSALVVYSSPVSDEILFSFEPVNILVEAKTGDLYVIDPL